MFAHIFDSNQVWRSIPFQLSVKLGWVWEAILLIVLVLVLVGMGEPRIALLLPKADHGLLVLLPQADCGRQNWRFFWRFCETPKPKHWRNCWLLWLKRCGRHCGLLWLKRFGRWGLCRPKAHLSGNVQRSWGENFWVGYTWPRHKLGNLISKWSWPVSTETVCNGIILYMYHRYKSKGISKKALGLGIGAGFLGGAALGVAGGMATASVYQRSGS